MEALATALDVVMTPTGVFLIVAGCLLAMLMGMLPGLSGTEALLIVLPFTFELGLSESMLLLGSAYPSSYVGGALTSILFGIPGTATSMATVFDGHPLHLQKRTIYAVTVAAGASAVGGVVSLCIVVALMPVIEPLSLLFGPAEWFAFVVFGLIALAFSNEARFVRTLVSACLGFLVASVGMSILTAVPRYTFGLSELWGGIPLIATFVGLYPFTEALYMALGREQALPDGVLRQAEVASSQKGQVRAGLMALVRHYDTVALGSLTGWLVGVIPGVGATLANILGWLLAKGVAKDPSKFGKGDVRGLIAAETANNASVGGALIPTLALGIPGSLNTAILLGVFMINGIQPGTNIYTENLDVTWVILIAVASGTVLASILIMAGGWRLVKIVARVKPQTIVPLIIFVGCMAVLLSRNNPADLVTAAAMTGVGVLMKRYGYSRVAFIIALLLGPLVETSFFQALSIGRGSYMIFVGSTVSVVIWLAVIGCLMIHIKRVRSGAV